MPPTEPSDPDHPDYNKDTVEYHTCPYEVEIHNNREDICQCSPAQQARCAEEV